MGPRDLLRALRERAARLAQTVLLPAGLFLAYFIGVGLTWVLARLLRPDVLSPRREAGESFWREAEGYGDDERDARSQS
ncbi:MAG: hypothetical protein HYX59_13625 [Elusimicrobia bacterium]|nr:hypothetical protein [Elusimicrobiota bacterium]